MEDKKASADKSLWPPISIEKAYLLSGRTWFDKLTTGRTLRGANATKSHCYPFSKSFILTEKTREKEYIQKNWQH